MSRSRIALLVASVAVVLVLAGGGFLVGVGAVENTARQVVLFSEVYSLALENYVDPVEPEALLDGALEGVMGALDAHGAFLAPEEVARWKSAPRSGSADPGLSVLKAFGALQVVAVAAGSPAEAAGIGPGDQIRRIDGRPLRNLSLVQGTRLLRGEPGSSVKLSVLHLQEGFRREELTLKRVARSERPYRLEVNGGVGVLKVLDLTRVPPDALSAELEQVRSRGVDKLLVDLRDLAAGGPRDAVGILKLFATGDFLELRDRAGRAVASLSGEGPANAWPGRVAVLVNGATADGAEAVARVLQLRRSATIYGEASYGLGAEPKLIELPDGSGVLLSAYRWVTPDGKGWNGEGLVPDQVVHGTGRTAEAAADQLRRALEEFEAGASAQPERKAA